MDYLSSLKSFRDDPLDFYFLNVDREYNVVVYISLIGQYFLQIL